VTIKVLARCAESLAERPVPFSIRITAEIGSDLQRDIKAFDKYGTPFTAPMGTTDAEITLPGGLGGTITGGSVRIGAPASGPASGYDIRLQVTDPSGEVIAETLVNMQPPTTGPSGKGVRGYGTEQHGAFTLEVLTDLDAQAVSFAMPPRRPRRQASRPGASRRAAAPGIPVPERAAVRPAHYGPVTHQPDPLPEGAGSIKGAGVIADLIEALTVIQDRTTIQITVPDFETLTCRRPARFSIPQTSSVAPLSPCRGRRSLSTLILVPQQPWRISSRYCFTESSRSLSAEFRRASDTSRSTWPPRASTPEA